MTFQNPLIPGFNPDPSVVAVDGAYYLVTSTFEYLPGIPVYRYWTAETCASFTGRVIGMYAREGTVRFAGYRYQGADA